MVPFVNFQIYLSAVLLSGEDTEDGGNEQFTCMNYGHETPNTGTYGVSSYLIRAVSGPPTSGACFFFFVSEERKFYV